MFYFQAALNAGREKITQYFPSQPQQMNEESTVEKVTQKWLLEIQKHFNECSEGNRLVNCKKQGCHTICVTPYPIKISVDSLEKFQKPMNKFIATVVTKDVGFESSVDEIDGLLPLSKDKPQENLLGPFFIFLNIHFNNFHFNREVYLKMAQNKEGTDVVFKSKSGNKECHVHSALLRQHSVLKWKAEKGTEKSYLETVDDFSFDALQNFIEYLYLEKISQRVFENTTSLLELAEFADRIDYRPLVVKCLAELADNKDKALEGRIISLQEKYRDPEQFMTGFGCFPSLNLNLLNS